MMKSSTKTRKVSSGAVQIAQKTHSTETFEEKLERLKLLEQREKLKQGLPHKYGFKFYDWQLDYINSFEKMCLLCAANQIGKSVCNFIKMITWATEPSLWPKLWDKKPIQFWYFLPGKDNVTTEFRTKWIPELLPRGEFKNHPQYGWREEFRNKHLWAIHFNTGVSIYIHTYGQDVMHLQGGTVDAIFVDEEVPWELIPEMMMRINARNGYFNAVMTPTIGQEMWRRVFEVRGEGEVFPDAYKKQVSIYECQKFSDGTLSHWTDQRITQTLNRLGTQAEIDLRAHGKFTVQEGLKLPAFNRDVNVAKPIDVTGWYFVSGVDPGGGGQGSLPAIVFLAIRPDFQASRVTEVWRGVPEKIYTAQDVFDQYVDMKKSRPMLGEFYDYGAKDFGTIATRQGFSFQTADKDRKRGFALTNTLLKNSMLIIDSTEPNQDLILEITTLREDQNKRNAPDDAVDALRYALMSVPWNFDGMIGEREIIKQKKILTQEDYRRGEYDERENSLWSNEEEIEELNAISDGLYE